uniref:ANK_REP_REGION domain-containing protein n=1 Tax=Strongyloides papillosus TaxID=174720 RepID=A0A0N5BFC4_STREA
MVFEDPLKIKHIIGFSVSPEIRISDLLYDYKSLLETTYTMPSISNISSNSTGDGGLYEKICNVISLDDHQEFEKLLRIQSLANIIHTKDFQDRSVLTLLCIVDKPKIASVLLKKGLSIDDRDKLGRNALYWAVKCESIKIVKWLLQLPINENFILSKDNQGITSLHIAATKSSSEILRLLLDALPNKNKSLLRNMYDTHNRMPLHYAAASGSLECVEKFMDEALSLPVSIRDMYGNTPLMLACGNNYASEVIRCLSNKQSVSVASRNGYGMSALHIAVLANNIDGVRILLEECKIPTEIYDKDYKTLLHYAAQNGNFKIVEILLSNGARYNACDKYRATPLHYAAEISWPIFYVLVSKNSYNDCEMADKEGRTPFMWAVVSENERVISKMLKTFDIPRHGKDNHNYTALHLAAFTGNVSICKTLLQQGWVVTAEDKFGATPLHIAAGKGFTNIVQIFCTSNEIIGKVDINLRTALFYAALGGQPRTLNVMVSDLGFDKMAKDILNRTALHAAAYCGFVACVQKLIDHGVEINAIDIDEETPLHVACSRGKEDVVRVLVKSGAMINPYSRINEITPLNYAIANKHTELIQFLKERNAVTGEEIRNIAASIITRAIRRYVTKKQQCLLGLLSGSTIQLSEQSSNNLSRFPDQCIYRNDNLLKILTRNRRSSQSTDRHTYENGLSVEVVNTYIYDSYYMYRLYF